MKRIVTISAAVVLGTLMFNVTLVQAGDKGHKDNGNSSSKHSSSDKYKDFWKDLVCDFDHDFCHHGSNDWHSGPTENMGGTKNHPPGTPGGPPLPTPVSGGFHIISGTTIYGPVVLSNPKPVIHRFPISNVNLTQQLQKGKQIPNIGTGLKGFTGAVGSAVDSGMDAFGSVGLGVAKGVGSVVGGVEGAVSDVANGVEGAISDIF
jgi:hypothetical protein